MLSQTAEYALRAMVHLAMRGETLATTVDIADATKVPAGYLSKVMQSLARADLVHSQRGLGGGFSLARPADQITALEVINAVDPIKRIERCPLGLDEHRDQLCPLHRRIDQMIATVESTFKSTTIEEMAISSRSKKLCQFPATPPGKS
ncbi:MAG: Rrf2 family transcriptional regulator [Pirellulales bacterium]